MFKLGQLMPNNLKKILTLAIAIGSLISAGILLATAPTAKVTEQTVSLLPVHASAISPQSVRPVYHAFGRIEAKQVLLLSAQVTGQLDKLHPSFIEGGNISAGDIIYQIDSSDFQYKLNLRQNELTIAQANLALEQGEQTAAKHEYNQLSNELKKVNHSQQEELMLRRPQLSIAKSNVDIAYNNMKLADQELKRTSVTSNGNYTVTQKLVHQGSFVSKGTVLGELVNLSTLRISIAVPNHIASNLKLQQSVTVITQNDVEHQAKITQVSATLQPKSQLQQIYIEIDNHQHNLVLGEFVQVNLNLPPINNVLRLPYSYLINDSYWAVNHQAILIRKKANILWQNEQHVFIANNLIEGEKIVTSQLSNPSLNSKVSIIEDLQ